MSKKKSVQIELDDVSKMFESAQMFSCKPGEGFSRPSPGTVLDEEKSVRWNREEVSRLRDAYEEEVNRLNREMHSLIKKANDMVCDYIIQETGLSKEKAKYLWGFVYSKYHDGWDLFTYLEEFIELANNLTEEFIELANNLTVN